MGRPDGFERWRGELERMVGEGYGKKRMSRETGISYNTLKRYLARMEAEGPFEPADGAEDPDALLDAASARRVFGVVGEPGERDGEREGMTRG